jgi:hypothetical protein
MMLKQCVSGRAKVAIGVTSAVSFENQLEMGEPGDFVVFGKATPTASSSFRSRKTTREIIYDPPQERTTIYKGRMVSR